MNPGAPGLSPRAQRLADHLRAWPRVRVPLVELWRLLDHADPTSRTDARRRSILVTLLDELAAAGVVAMPAPRSFDRTEHPPLPRFVTVAAQRQPGSAAVARQEILWHPELSWVPGGRLTATQLDQLAAINTWMFRRRTDLVVPTRERSLEIFSDEKALDRLMLTSLFEPGRLSLAALRTRRAIPRMFTSTVGEGGTILIVENSDTFDSLVRTLTGRRSRIGIVGWGAGTGFEASVLSISDLNRQVTGIRYFGDLDRNGLRIPANASDVAVACGLPQVQPAVQLYDALFHLGRPQPSGAVVDEPTAAQLVRWLHPAHRDQAAHLLQSGQRLAQEAVGLSYLLSRDDWQPP